MKVKGEKGGGRVGRVGWDRLVLLCTAVMMAFAGEINIYQIVAVVVIASVRSFVLAAAAAAAAAITAPLTTWNGLDFMISAAIQFFIHIIVMIVAVLGIFGASLNETISPVIELATYKIRSVVSF